MLPQGFSVPERRTDRSRGPYTIDGVRACGSVGARIAGVHTQGAASPLDGVTVDLGGVQTGCEGVTGLSGGRGAGMGLAKGDGGSGGA